MADFADHMNEIASIQRGSDRDTWTDKVIEEITTAVANAAAEGAFEYRHFLEQVPARVQDDVGKAVAAYFKDYGFVTAYTCVMPEVELPDYCGGRGLGSYRVYVSWKKGKPPDQAAAVLLNPIEDPCECARCSSGCVTPPSGTSGSATTLATLRKGFMSVNERKMVLTLVEQKEKSMSAADVMPTVGAAQRATMSPQSGDVWTEMFSCWLHVVRRDGDKVLTRFYVPPCEVPSGCREEKWQTLEEFAKEVRHMTFDGNQRWVSKINGECGPYNPLKGD